ncbi:endonuclease/exonuclease/phosphatase family protein [Ruegeria sp. 2205SS24-7]|uniref:endonuclease/exonuclease/phosphatase family protein n=1 Tax=Ruegeria discodermiae TaxID=3064389 RepID=UPI002740D79C|nr:endonuclease/exonuclease/phosphatase family protein [Ruegeria sp. 2205SS24-7]MDP5218863.1 endonuclease/exonuclease/phosphatase family protein [Ruegeria sp. 2205SS24-7]
MPAEQLRCATWNVHRAKGSDGRVDPGRVVEAMDHALTPLDLDVLALQEADEERPPHAGILDVREIAARTKLTYIDDPALRWGPDSDGFLGTILFISPSLRRMQADVIDLPGHCHRGAVSFEVTSDKRPVRLISTHLSLSQPLRIIQMRVIGQYLRRRPPMQTILLGDLNEWRPWGGLMLNRRLLGTALRGPVCRSFPSTRPILPLDRILTDAPGEVRQLRAVASAEVARASDHLPLAATVTVP